MKRIVILMVVVLLPVLQAIASQAIVVVKVANGIPNARELNERLATGWWVVTSTPIYTDQNITSIVYVVQRKTLGK